MTQSGPSATFAIPAGIRIGSRISLLLAVAAMAATVLPTPLAAGSLFRGTHVETTVSCYVDVSPTTSVFATIIDFKAIDLAGNVIATSSDAWSELWTGGEPTLYRNSDLPAVIDVSGMAFSATVPLVFADGGQPAGTSSITGSISPGGDIVPMTQTSSDTNQRIERSGTFRSTSAATSVSFPDEYGVFALPACYASVALLDVVSTRPDAITSWQFGHGIDCVIENDEGGVARVYASHDGASLQVYVSATDATSNLIAFGAGTLRGNALSVDLTVIDASTGTELPAGSLAFEIAPVGEAFSSVQLSRSGWVRTSGSYLDIDGTIALPAGRSYDADDCELLQITYRNLVTTESGPQTTDEPPSNETPDTAAALTPGHPVTVRTNGAALAPEVSMCSQSGRTVWYSVDGTGGSMTLDTGGSRFDTVATVYTADEGGLEEVACVDDVPDGPFGAVYQSMVTWDSVAGQEYLVQIGGWGVDPEFGMLRVALR